MSSLLFDKGTLLLKGSVGSPYGKWDPRSGCYRVKSCHYRDVLGFFRESGLPIEDTAQSLSVFEQLKSSIELRGYQDEALDKWSSAGRRGVLVLPTAAGKTFIALRAVDLLQVQTLIVVPTLDLLDQWKRRVWECLGVEAGVVGGGECVIRMVTIATYDSAYLQAAFLGNKFLLLVFDEVHHLASPGYMQIAEMYLAPYRMGLTATYERSDKRHDLLPLLVGDPVYSVSVKELTASKHLSDYTYEKVAVELTVSEQQLYEANMAVFKAYLAQKHIVLRSALAFQRFIMSTGRDPKAREALLARNKALKIAVNSEAKLAVLAEKLALYHNEKVLIFTLYNDLVYAISRRFFIPAVTYRTSREERREILANFSNGTYSVIVTSQVLDEGVDVPDASVGIVLGGTGSKREFVQRLGRLLRRQDGKIAKLIEIISKETVEVNISRRRHVKQQECNRNVT
ncbi:MAG: DEAD/DEAH box helicase family protein [Candidatus Bathyarchaeota archaeon]|uniref:DEAD/DEAH box helicase family protein n=1 Tax=Candidatus Bathycorpusculum sp. TaxID=2994959 RepID=UPI0028224CEF|nr:DEAD/DEAH box helicase family protein [Candidatus Termiticorpusculum sp.]MCL2257253.1 DEAD/DEAH box helicase family protein [Candidatus Termiticorpusculum sp.]MCL2292622.1 DEAD/DEAH box helicase family protein [Candidatus Termiticorpusculum sp.]